MSTESFDLRKVYWAAYSGTHSLSGQSSDMDMLEAYAGLVVLCSGWHIPARAMIWEPITGRIWLGSINPPSPYGGGVVELPPWQGW